MTSASTREFMALMAIWQYHGRPHTPTDQAHIVRPSQGRLAAPRGHRRPGRARSRAEPGSHRIQHGAPARWDRLRYPRRRALRPGTRHPPGPQAGAPTGTEGTHRAEPQNEDEPLRRTAMSWVISGSGSITKSEAPQVGLDIPRAAGVKRRPRSVCSSPPVPGLLQAVSPKLGSGSALVDLLNSPDALDLPMRLLPRIDIIHSIGLASWERPRLGEPRPPPDLHPGPVLDTEVHHCDSCDLC